MVILNFNQEEESFKTLEKHKPYKAFDVFFRFENHLLGRYTCLPQDISPYGILESHDGSIFALSQINCGYNGTGPRRTQRLLEWLGVEPRNAEKWKYSAGIHVEFDPSGVWIPSSLQLGAFFDSREAQASVLLSESVFAEPELRTLYFVDPQKRSYQSLFQSIQKCKPVEFTYYYGEHYKDHISFPFELTAGAYGARKRRNLDFGGFIRIQGEQFHIVCFVAKASIYSVIQNLYTYFFKQPLFFETRIGEVIILSHQPITQDWRGYLNLFTQMLFSKYSGEGYASKVILQPPKRPRSTDNEDGAQ